MYCQDPSIAQEDDGDIEGSDSDDVGRGLVETTVKRV